MPKSQRMAGVRTTCPPVEQMQYPSQCPQASLNLNVPPLSESHLKGSSVAVFPRPRKIFILHSSFFDSTDTRGKSVSSLHCACSPTNTPTSARLPIIKVVFSHPLVCSSSPWGWAAHMETCSNLNLSSLPHCTSSKLTTGRDPALLTTCLSSLLLSLHREPLQMLPAHLQTQDRRLHLWSQWKWTKMIHVEGARHSTAREASRATAPTSASVRAKTSVPPRRARPSTWASTPMRSSCASVVHLSLGQTTTWAQASHREKWSPVSLIPASTKAPQHQRCHPGHGRKRSSPGVPPSPARMQAEGVRQPHKLR